MKQLYKFPHAFLCHGDNFNTCRERVLRFFDRNILVKYDTVGIIIEKSFSAEKNDFWPALEHGIETNRTVLAGLINELAGQGFNSLNDLTEMPQGFESKTLHTVTHLLDGFFGIDSRFYNLEDDSHWLSETRRRSIRAAPSGYWLIEAEGSSTIHLSGPAPFFKNP